MTDREDVLATAAGLVEAFGSGRLDEYFGCFAEDASFIFHTTDRVLHSVVEYREEWATWQRDDNFRVLACRSSDQRVQLVGDAAVFTHRVHTVTSTRAGKAETDERETIVFARQPDGRWLGVHEHLSPEPASGDVE